MFYAVITVKQSWFNSSCNTLNCTLIQHLRPYLMGCDLVWQAGEVFETCLCSFSRELSNYRWRQGGETLLLKVGWTCNCKQGTVKCTEQEQTWLRGSALFPPPTTMQGMGMLLSQSFNERAYSYRLSFGRPESYLCGLEKRSDLCRQGCPFHHARTRIAAEVATRASWATQVILYQCCLHCWNTAS